MKFLALHHNFFEIHGQFSYRNAPSHKLISKRPPDWIIKKTNRAVAVSTKMKDIGHRYWWNVNGDEESENHYVNPRNFSLQNAAIAFWYGRFCWSVENVFRIFCIFCISCFFCIFCISCFFCIFCISCFFRISFFSCFFCFFLGVSWSFPEIHFRPTLRSDENEKCHEDSRVSEKHQITDVVPSEV